MGYNNSILDSLANTKEMHKWDYYLNETLDFFTKIWVWVVVIFMGLAGKFGLYMLGDKKLSFIQLCGSFLIAASVGITVAIICYLYYPAPPGGISIQGAVFIPISGILSDRIAMFVMAMNGDKAIKIMSNKKLMAILRIFLSKNTKKDEE